MSATRLLIGTAGWSYADWKGIVYPDPRPRGFDELSYLARLFNTVEVNATFYRPPTAKMAAGWVRKTEDRPDFVFTAKLWQRFTHDRDARWTRQDVAVFREGLAPLVDAGKLGGLLVQFPWFFDNQRASRERLARIAGDFRGERLFLEVRHRSWLAGACQDMFRKLGYGFVNIDQPLSRSAIPPTALATGKAAYFRFHGRNAKAWFDKKAGRDEKYDYLYSDEELDPWVEKIRALVGEVEVIHVVTNNHFRGQAPANALQIVKKLTGESPAVPLSMVEAFPFLNSRR